MKIFLYTICLPSSTDHHFLTIHEGQNLKWCLQQLLKAFLFHNLSQTIFFDSLPQWHQGCSDAFFSSPLPPFFLMSKMLLLTLSLFTPLCSLCKDSVHTDLIGSKGTPIHLLPNGIASSRGEGWHSPCQGDGEVLLLIIADDGGNNLSRHQARQLSIKAPLIHFHLLLLLLPPALCAPCRLPFPLLSFAACPLRKKPPALPRPRSEHDGCHDLTGIGAGVGGGGGGLHQ